MYTVSMDKKTTREHQITRTQLDALREINDEWGGRLSNNMGISTPTIRALERLGLVEISWGRRSEELAPAGWTGRVYVSQHWFAVITDAGREELAR